MLNSPSQCWLSSPNAFSWKGIHLFLCLIALLSPWITAEGKDYQITDLDITIQLKQDGTMEVNEKRTYQFEGDFSYVYRFFPLEGNLIFHDIHIEEQDQEYPVAQGGTPGTMSLDTQDQKVKATAYFHASNTSRTFEFHFTVDKAIKRYQDAATLDYPILSDEWEKDHHHIEVQVIPPENFNQNEVEKWVHGTLRAGSKVTADGTIEFKVDTFYENDELRIRALYPESLFPELYQRDKTIKEAFRAKSEQLIKEAQLARKRKNWIIIAAGPYALLLILFWFWLFRTYRQKPDPLRSPKKTSEPPSNHKPAAINYLMDNDLSMDQVFSATLLDLANQGFINVERIDEKNFLGYSEDKALFHLNRRQWESSGNTLGPQEYRLLAFFYEKLADENDQFSTDTLEDKQGTVQHFLEEWIKAIREDLKKHQWFDKTSKQGRNIGVVVSVTLIVILLTMAALYSGWTMLLAGITLPFFVASFFIVHRTKKGLTLYQDWKAFKKYLKERQYLSVKDKITEETFYQYLIYALALGLSEEELKALGNDFENLFPDREPHFLTGIQQAQDTIGVIMSTVMTTTTVAASTASGGGGGSGGGGAG